MAGTLLGMKWEPEDPALGWAVQRPHVLMVEGHDAVAAALLEGLNAARLPATRVQSLRAAEDAAHHGRCQVWLVGSALLDASGEQALARMREADPRTPALWLCAPGHEERGLAAGATEVTCWHPGLQWRVAGQLRRMASEHARTGQREASVNSAVRSAGNRSAVAMSDAPRAGQWLAAVSHDLRTPLTTILGFSGVMLEGASGPLTAEQVKQLGLVQSAAQRLLTLVNDVLDLARLDARRTELVSVPVQLRALLEEVFAQAREQLAGGPLNLSVQGPPLTIESDPTRLRQVVWNVCLYACRNLEAHTPTLSVAPRHGGGALIRIDAAGARPVPDELARMLLADPQEGPPSPGREAASGLGLVLAAQLAHALGGALSVVHQVGLRTTFELRLPARLGPLQPG